MEYSYRYHTIGDGINIDNCFFSLSNIVGLFQQSVPVISYTYTTHIEAKMLSYEHAMQISNIDD